MTRGREILQLAAGDVARKFERNAVGALFQERSDMEVVGAVAVGVQPDNFAVHLETVTPRAPFVANIYVPIEPQCGDVDRGLEQDEPRRGVELERKGTEVFRALTLTRIGLAANVVTDELGTPRSTPLIFNLIDVRGAGLRNCRPDCGKEYRRKQKSPHKICHIFHKSSFFSHNVKKNPDIRTLYITY